MTITHKVIVSIPALETWLSQHSGKLDEILKGVQEIMANLTRLQDDVTKNGSVGESAVALIKGLAQQVADLEPNQEAIDQLSEQLETQAQALADAITANTPAAPTA